MRGWVEEGGAEVTKLPNRFYAAYPHASAAGSSSWQVMFRNDNW